MTPPARPSIPPWLKRAFALPNLLYAHRCGWLLGRRFLQIGHLGRTSGREFHTVVEVVRYDRATGEATVVSGHGPAADWLRNITAAGRAHVDLGHGPRPADFRVLGLGEAVEVYAAYERRNALIRPVVYRTLTALLGWDYNGSDPARRRMAEQLPMIAFRPAGQPSPDVAAQLRWRRASRSSTAS